MNHDRLTSDLPEFRTDDDFAEFVASVEECRATNQAFYMCKEGALRRVLVRTYKQGMKTGYFAGGLTTLMLVTLAKLTPIFRDFGRELVDRVRK